MEKFSEALAEKAADKEAQLDAEYKKVNELKEYFVPRLVNFIGYRLRNTNAHKLIRHDSIRNHKMKSIPLIQNIFPSSD